MKYLLIFSLIYAMFIPSTLNAQFPTIPQEIKDEVEIKSINVNGRLVSYGIVYPKDDDKKRAHPALICLTGGGFSEYLAYAYHYVYAPKETFQEYIKIYLIARGKSFLSYNAKDWIATMTQIHKKEHLTAEGWVISGASNGGVATYGLISALPKKFSGFITIPGSMGNHLILDEWKTYKVLLVYMNQDYGWIESTKRDYKRLKEHIPHIELFEIKGYGHILTKDYDIEIIYKKYLAL